MKVIYLALSGLKKKKVHLQKETFTFYHSCPLRGISVKPVSRCFDKISHLECLLCTQENINQTVSGLFILG